MLRGITEGREGHLVMVQTSGGAQLMLRGKYPPWNRRASLKFLEEGKQILWPIKLKEGDQQRSVRHQAPPTSPRAFCPRKEKLSTAGEGSEPSCSQGIGEDVLCRGGKLKKHFLPGKQLSWALGSVIIPRGGSYYCRRDGKILPQGSFRYRHR